MSIPKDRHHPGGLFPAPPPTDWASIPIKLAISTELVLTLSPIQFVSQITAEELGWAVSKLPKNKASGLDLIPNEIIKLTANRFLDAFLSNLNACTSEASSPTGGKEHIWYCYIRVRTNQWTLPLAIVP